MKFKPFQIKTIHLCYILLRPSWVFNSKHLELMLPSPPWVHLGGETHTAGLHPPRTSCGLRSPPGSPEGAGSTLLAPGDASKMDSDQEGRGFGPASGCGLGAGSRWPAGDPAVGPARSADPAVEQGSQDAPLCPASPRPPCATMW